MSISWITIVAAAHEIVVHVGILLFSSVLIYDVKCSSLRCLHDRLFIYGDSLVILSKLSILILNTVMLRVLTRKLLVTHLLNCCDVLSKHYAACSWPLLTCKIASYDIGL